MSEVLETREQETERAARPVLRRTFVAELTPGDGRTVDARIVPYNVAEEVRDKSDDGRVGPLYREEWAPGAFDEQLVAGHRLKVLVNFEHERGAPNVVGKCVGLRSLPDGLHGSFEMRRSEAGEMALELVKEGILDGVSLEAFPKAKGSERTAAGVVRRTRAHLHNVALCRYPAFKDAVVLSVRGGIIADPPPPIDERLLPVPVDPELIERCRRLGMKVPQRYTAHPAETGTPALTGTPEDGTRLQSEEPKSSEV